jgi:hypothetical protein
MSPLAWRICFLLLALLAMTLSGCPDDGGGSYGGGGGASVSAGGGGGGGGSGY